ncbi:tetratricopeptide repeat protein [Paraliomyxa miuraensis]|uniref:tetratricopeptide repeat protein n=1 Tax=Paraliomyxa miuraensis TaxID=376150 RepID=UPI00225B437E|nr:tetratricopeptide repeat protein [Paraliomyxa miuraensis]MCX4244916.1 tetratricopeptide repeat protein [Paraliomyxa miuraensis]
MTPSDESEPAPVPAVPSLRERLPRWLVAALLALVMLRIAYHCAYLVEVPFSLATFSDGRLYEEAARDLLDAPPWGTEPFYLQGLYAYQLAMPMLIRPWISLALLFQLVLAGLVLWGLHRALAPVLGRRDAALSLLVLLLYPGLSFYENKILTASLAVGTMVLMLLALARLQARPGVRAVVLLGFATGLAVLARGNMLLAVPAVAVAAALAWAPTGRPRWQGLGWLALGLLLALSPMALRNAIVTGRPSIMPVHGGGTSFYIGNNRHARGVWNSAGGLLSGEVVHEQQELAATLGVPEGPKAEQAAAIGRALYRRSFDEIGQEPGRWLWLELRKGWLLIGNDELSQDYDVAGERELLPWSGIGLPFCVVLGVGLVGGWGLWRRARAEPEFCTRLRPWAWLLGGQLLAVVAANLLFFTSAQHRLPLVVPLAMGLGPGISWLARGRSIAGTRADRRAWGYAWAIVALVVVQGIWPRQRVEGPTPEHYYNLAIAYVQIGQPHEAIVALDRAVARRPDHPVILIERATLERRMGRFDECEADLDRLSALPNLPPWIAGRVDEERRRVAALRSLVTAPE